MRALALIFLIATTAVAAPQHKPSVRDVLIAVGGHPYEVTQEKRKSQPQENWGAPEVKQKYHKPHQFCQDRTCQMGGEAPNYPPYDGLD